MSILRQAGRPPTGRLVSCQLLVGGDNRCWFPPNRRWFGLFWSEEFWKPCGGRKRGGSWGPPLKIFQPRGFGRLRSSIGHWAPDGGRLRVASGLVGVGPCQGKYGRAKPADSRVLCPWDGLHLGGQVPFAAWVTVNASAAWGDSFPGATRFHSWRDVPARLEREKQVEVPQ